MYLPGSAPTLICSNISLSNLNYDDINIDEVLESVAAAVEQGNYRKAVKKEFMEVRLAALGAIVHEMQDTVKKDKELIHAV